MPTWIKAFYFIFLISATAYAQLPQTCWAHIPYKVRNELSAYLLPDSDPIKPILDEIFSKSRVIFDLKSMKEAGFVKPKVRKWTRVVVTKHPKIPGYIIKAYLDIYRSHGEVPDYYHWIERIKGATLVRGLIEQYHLERFFKVPEKWVYLLPETPFQPVHVLGKQAILIEKDMHVLDREQNAKRWRSAQVTPALLQGLFLILEEAGLSDCTKRDNIPFCVDGKVAFVDTEIYHQWPISYENFSHSLSKMQKNFWKRMTHHH
jgi:hypothetical protein